MSRVSLTVNELLQYTDEERARWENWFREHGENLLTLPVTGSQEETVGGMLLHIFGPELRFVERMNSKPLTEYRSLPKSQVAEVFGFSLRSRKAMRRFVENAEEPVWERMVEMQYFGETIQVSIRKLLFHTLIHEIRHWAQVARIVRERGMEPPGEHDLIFSRALK